MHWGSRRSASSHSNHSVVQERKTVIIFALHILYVGRVLSMAYGVICDKRSRYPRHLYFFLVAASSPSHSSGQLPRAPTATLWKKLGPCTLQLRPHVGKLACTNVGQIHGGVLDQEVAHGTVFDSFTAHWTLEGDRLLTRFISMKAQVLQLKFLQETWRVESMSTVNAAALTVNIRACVSWEHLQTRLCHGAVTEFTL